MPLTQLGTGMSQLVLDDLQAKVSAAMGAAQAAQSTADTAQATGKNARDMVLARDTTLNTAATQASDAAAKYTTLAGLAADYQTALAASLADRQALHAALDALVTRIASLESKQVTVQTKRVTTTALLALGASVDLTATWTTAFPDANYVVIPLLDASTGLASIGPIGVKSQTKDGAVVTVKATAAVAAGLSVNVVGLRFG